MAIGSAKVSGIYLIEKATFTTAAPVGGDTFTHVPAIDQPLPVLEQGTDDAVEGNEYGATTPPVATVKKSTLQVTTRVWNGSKVFGTGTDPTTCFMQKALESYFGAAANTAFAGTTIAAASGLGKTTPLKVSSATGLAVGKAVRNAATGEGAIVKAISGTDITLSRDFSAAAQNTVLEGAFDFFPTLGQYNKALWVNHERDSVKRLLGAGGAFTLQMQGVAAGNTLRYVFGLEFNTYAAGLTISSKTPNAFVTNALIAKGSELIIDGTENVCFYDGQIDFGIGKEWVECDSGDEGRDGFVNTDVEGAGMTFSEYYDADRWTSHDAQSPHELMVVFYAPSGGGGALVYMPNVTFKVADAVNGKKEAQTVTVKAHMPTTAQQAAGFTWPISYHVFSGE